MAITEADRHRLYPRLEEVLGHEQAATLMEHLPPVGWADVATRRDIDQLAFATGRDIEQLRDATRGDIDQVRSDIEQLRDATRGDIEQVRDATRGDIEQLGDRLRAEWRHELLLQTFALIGANVALVGAAFAVARLG